MGLSSAYIITLVAVLLLFGVFSSRLSSRLNMPVLLLSGREDAVGDAGRGVQALHRLLWTLVYLMLREPQAEGIATFPEEDPRLRSQLVSSEAGLTPKGGTLPRRLPCTRSPRD